MTLGQYLIRYRESRNLSQRQLAVLCNVSNGYIAMLEKGLNPKTKKPIIPTLLQLKKLASGMGMSVSALVEAVDDMPVELSIPSLYAQNITGQSNLSPVEQQLIRKFRELDERGQAAVLNVLDYEHTAIPQTIGSEQALSADETRSVIRVAARDGSYHEHTLTKQQAANLQVLLDQLPDVPEGL